MTAFDPSHPVDARMAARREVRAAEERLAGLAAAREAGEHVDELAMRAAALAVHEARVELLRALCR